MSGNKMVDLDILRPERKMTKLANKEFDLSYIPVGITFEVDELVNELSTLDMEKLKINDPEEVKKGLSLSVKLCATFTSFWEPEINEDWWMKNANAFQIRKMADQLKETLADSYEGVRVYGKN